MNIKNNKRRRESQEKIMRAFIQRLQTQDLMDITVSELIKDTGLNRSTFYANYADIFELAEKTRAYLESDFSSVFAEYDYYRDRSGALKLFTHIRDNQLFYTTYFKLCYDDSHLISTYDPRRAELENVSQNVKYHIEFFRNGLNAIIKLWLAGGCRESPEEMAAVLKQEYRGR